MNKRTLIASALTALLLLLLNFQSALAHESITVGDYTVEVGWLNEPPVVGQQNGIVINVSKTSDGQPVEDVSALTVTISYGGQNKTLTLQPLGEDTPGHFVAPILPTIPGEYTIELGGSLENTAANAETHVEEVQPADILQFPKIEAVQPTDTSSMTTWLIYSSLAIGLIALILGVTALRRTR